MKQPVLVIAGPTASGKSALAVALAAAFDGTVVNADSMQVYAELAVLTARPGPAEEARVPHRLFGALPASEPCSAGRWLAMARDAIDEAWGAGRLPVVVGGTGLYLKVLTEGLADVPEVLDAVTEDVRGHYEAVGEDAFRAELAEADPDAAAGIAAGDGQRLKRALAVVRATGRTLADWQDSQPPGPAVDARFLTLALAPDRDALYAAIDARFDRMVAAGALAEVAALAALGLSADLPAMKAVGVKELSRHLAGECSLADAVAAAKRASRNYAKRQLTWLRTQLAVDRVIEGGSGPAALAEAAAAVRAFLGGA